MAETTLQTAADLRHPLVRQFAVFCENKLGALLNLTRTLGLANVHICGVSVVDTADAALIRLIVDDPEHCRTALHHSQIAATESPLVVVE
jgi:hypothetical protein